ncbi:hypothetical protein [Rubripirellula reticaptiva]|uniref:Uncharacterized protein n=1 Tax=Rubripirellula reticaptiva TaxID=2528013 RepID=A0A5C6FBH8_9BACT|nr:hypothetical protein [Rubripirellula reticaptiva]TWU57930.1 hypothetical protein Poly59_08390 [Rubripirellula reticaptiva]
MFPLTAATNDEANATGWRLWIDGCGGFLLLLGDKLSVGRSDADIVVQADWPRRAGSIKRVEGDYFWNPMNSSVPGTPVDSDSAKPALIRDGQSLDIVGSANMKLEKRSPLSSTAVLTVSPPHRFDHHVDGIVLVDKTVLIGAGRDCHLRHRDATDVAILVHRPKGSRADSLAGWSVKLGLDGQFQELVCGRPVTLGPITMTLEPA